MLKRHCEPTTTVSLKNFISVPEPALSDRQLRRAARIQAKLKQLKKELCDLLAGNQ